MTGSNHRRRTRPGIGPRLECDQPAVRTKEPAATASVEAGRVKGASGMSGRFWPVLAGFSQVFPANLSVSKPTGVRSQTACLPAFTSMESGWIEPPPGPGIAIDRPFFTGWGTERDVMEAENGATPGFGKPARPSQASERSRCHGFCRMCRQPFDWWVADMRRVPQRQRTTDK